MLWSSNEVLFLCLIEYSIPIDEAYYLAVYPPSTVNAAPVINRASSLMASCRVIFVTAALAAAYGVSSSVPTKPKIDEKLTIEPPPFSRKSGTVV